MISSTTCRTKIPIEKRYVDRLLVSVVVSVGAAFFCPAFSPDAPVALFLLVKWAFVPTGSMVPVAAVVYTCFGFLVFCYLFSDFMEEGVSHSAVHIIVRSKSRFGWFTKRLSLMAAYALVYTVFVDVSLAVLGGISFSWQGVAFLASVVLLDFLMLQCVMAAVLLLATCLSSAASCVIVMCVHLITLCAFVSFVSDAAGRVAFVLPSVQGVYAIHGTAAIAPASALQVGLVGLEYSYVYLSVLLFVLALALWARFAKCDLL